MSVQTVQGSSALWHTDHLAPDFSIVTWYRRDTDTGADEYIIGNGSSTVRTMAQIVGANDTVRLIHSGGTTLFTPETTGVWRYLLLTYQGETTPGSSADGVATLKYLDDGDTAFQATAQQTGLSDLAWTDFVISCKRASAGAGEGLTGTFAFVKAWEGHILSDADALTERLEIPGQTNLANLTRDHRFGDGALTTDSSGNGNTLTAGGSPTFTADLPNALASSGGARKLAGRGGGLVGTGGLAGRGGGLVG